MQRRTPHARGVTRTQKRKRARNVDHGDGDDDPGGDVLKGAPSEEDVVGTHDPGREKVRPP